jgi:hypothetical protein
MAAVFQKISLPEVRFVQSPTIEEQERGADGISPATTPAPPNSVRSPLVDEENADDGIASDPQEGTPRTNPTPRSREGSLSPQEAETPREEEVSKEIEESKQQKQQDSNQNQEQQYVWRDEEFFSGK